MEYFFIVQYQLYTKPWHCLVFTVTLKQVFVFFTEIKELGDGCQ